MGRYDPRLSDDMRDALVRAQLDDGMSAPEAAKAATAGELGEPFDVSETTCRTLAREAKRDRPRAARDEPDEPDRVRAIAEKTIARVEALDAPASKDLHALQQAQRIVDAADRRMGHRSANAPMTGLPGELSPLTRLMLERMDDPQPKTTTAETRHALGRRWVGAEVTLEKREGGEWWQRVFGRPRDLEDAWHALGGADPAKLVARELVQLEELEARAASQTNGAPHTNGTKPDAT